MAEFLKYTNDVEVRKPDEEAVFDEIKATMLDISKKVGERQRHVTRSVHAKSHGLLKAELTVLDGLRPSCGRACLRGRRRIRPSCGFRQIPEIFCRIASRRRAGWRSR